MAKSRIQKQEEAIERKWRHLQRYQDRIKSLEQSIANPTGDHPMDLLKQRLEEAKENLARLKRECRSTL